MAKFSVFETRTIEYRYDVEADNREEAERLVAGSNEDGRIVWSESIIGCVIPTECMVPPTERFK